MPRPRKRRCCRGRFGSRFYKPAGIPAAQLVEVRLASDELEALRLCDAEGLTQEQAGEQMKISRGTIQRLITAARKKVAEALLNGHALVLEGNDLETEQEENNFCGCGRGRRGGRKERKNAGI